MKKGIIVIGGAVVLILLTCLVLYSVLFGDSDDEAVTDQGEAPAAESRPTPRPGADNPAEPNSWLVMLYMDADDEMLERDIFIDLNEAEMIGSTDHVTVIAQIDRYDGGYDGDGDWTTTKRFFVMPDESGDLEALNSEELEDLGELDMGDPQTLVDFVVWAINSYPADKHVLILSDHGMGWPGGWSDDDPSEESHLSTYQIADALMEIVSETGIGQFELVGFDACLMAQLEVFTMISPYARYAVASEETEPGVGWSYASILSELAENPAMTGADLGQAIVASYIDHDLRVVDDDARSALAEDYFGLTKDTRAEEIARALSQDITLAAVDLSMMRDLNAALNELVIALGEADQKSVAKARSYAQSYSSAFGSKEKPSYFDLGHFAGLLEEKVKDAEVGEAARVVQDLLGQAVFAEKHGPTLPGSSGMTIYFPNSSLYKNTAYDDSGWQQYSPTIDRFAAASLWDDFLAFHYTGVEIDPSSADLSVIAPAAPKQDYSRALKAAQPDKESQLKPPGYGEIMVSPVSASAAVIPVDGKVTLSATVTGDNIAYIYYYAAYYDESDGTYLTADMGFIMADETKEIGGVYYPDWGEDGEVEIEIDWEPTVYFMSDGNPDNDQFAYFEPDTYGLKTEDDIYTVYGVYRPVDGKGEREAIIRFDGTGAMRGVRAYTDSQNGASASWEIAPKPGDTFTIWEEWLEYNDAAGEWDYVYYEGGTMTFGKQGFTMEPYYAFAGQYMIGIIATDFEGNYTEAFTEVLVEDK